MTTNNLGSNLLPKIQHEHRPVGGGCSNLDKRSMTLFKSELRPTLSPFEFQQTSKIPPVPLYE